MKVVPTTTGTNCNNEDPGLLIYNEEEVKKIRFYKSIGCCLTTVISLSIVLSIIFITAVWVSTFSASLTTLAEGNRRNEFNKLETYLRQTIKDIENYGQMANRVLSKELEFYDLNKTDNLIFSMFKALFINTKGMIYLIWVADKDGNLLGVFNPIGSRPGVDAILILQYAGITGSDLHYYYCYNFLNQEYCERNAFGSPNEVSAISGSQILLYNMAIPYLGKTIWSPSYYDASTPGLLHINMVTAFNTTYVNNGKNNAIFAYDFAALTMTNYLNESTLHLPEPVVFVLETSTRKNLASNEILTIKPINGSSSFDFEYNYSKNLQSTSNFIYSYFNQKLTNLKCNFQYSLSFGNRYVNVMRICTENGIDWVLILSVEQWYYIGNIVIAIIAAVVASIVIIITGIFVGIYFSSRIVTPFRELIYLFTLVSNMELENIPIPKSFFSEVELIMYMFKEMVSRMKLYRSFIPGFLLTEIEEKMLKENVAEIEHSLGSKAPTNNSNSSRSISRTSLQLSSSFKFNNTPSFLHRFELGLENKVVTIVGLRLNNFESWMESVDNKEVINVTTLIFQIVQQLAKPGKGQVGNFENGYITISFNAAVTTENHELKGCHTATALIRELKQLNGKIRGPPLPFVMYCAVATDLAACGNLGTQDAKSFTIIGSIHKRIQEILEKNLEFEIPITITANVQKVIKNNYLCRCIENIRYYNNKQQLENLSVFELGEGLDVVVDEWMYEMQQKGPKDKWNNYNTGYDLYMKGQYKEALQKFEEHKLQYPNDKVCKKMIKLCQMG